MKYLLSAMVATLLLTSSSQAAVLYWHLGTQIGVDDTDWNDPDNWGIAGTNLPAVPGATDHVILNNFEPLTDPLIAGGPAPQVNILTPSWHNDITSTLNIGPGGSINTAGDVGGFARLSGGNNSTSTVNFLPGAGISVWNILQMSFNTEAQGLPPVGKESDSFINLDGGILHLGSLSFSNNGLNITNIDIGGTGQLLVNGDHTDTTGNGDETTWLDNDWITALDGTGAVGVRYDSENGRTVFTVETDLRGDFNGDGFVDSIDLVDWWQNDFGNNDFSDADGDGDSDGNDFLIWQQTYTGPPLTIAAVPEPSSLALCLVAASLGGLMVGRRH